MFIAKSFTNAGLRMNFISTILIGLQVIDETGASNGP